MAEENYPIESTEGSPPAEIESKTPLTILKEWPRSRKIALAALAVLSLALFSILIFQGRTADYQLLYANLSEKDAGQIVEWLKGERIPYKLKNDGKNIWIPNTTLHETRLSLAANGLPTGGGIGFEIFDKQSFALTDYVQKVNYLRALQGELSRSISSLEPVENARVHLALPEKRLFKEQQKPPTASVIVSLVQGRSLDQNQVRGIIHLVAGSVTGLAEENITIVDSNGVVLESGQRNDDSLLSVDMLEYQQEVENRLEMRAQSLLDKTMGEHNAMVRVTATLDFSKYEKTEELFSPDEPVVRSEQVTQEQSGNQTSGGIPGVQSNLQGASPLQGSNTGASSSSRTTNYEISKTVSKTVNPVGTLENISVSILVADRITEATDDKPATTTPRTDEELQSIKDMVSAAIGLDSKRGDKISVISMPFTASEEEMLLSQKMPKNIVYDYLPVIKIGLIAFGMLLVYLLLVRPIIKTFRDDVKEHYRTVEEMQREQIEAERDSLIAQEEEEEEEVDLVDLLREEALTDPTQIAHILKKWLRET